jgi:predicted metal-dependent hydrolase
MSPLRYLAGYPPHLLQQVQQMLQENRVHEVLAKRYPGQHDVRTDRALYEYAFDLKSRHMRNAGPLARVAYDGKLHVVHRALGIHTTVSRVQGKKLKTKCEIRVANVFKQAPEPFLKMIVVHELAHMKERDHDKAFYSLCTHMEPDYHQLEFDVRVWLTALEQAPDQEPASDG